MKNIFPIAALLPFLLCLYTQPGAQPVSVMDLHSDILLRIYHNDVDLADPPEWAQTSIPSLRAGHVEDQVFAVFINPARMTHEEVKTRAFEILDAFDAQMEKHSEHIALATTVAESEAIRASGRIAAWLWIEGGAAIGEDLDLLRQFYDRGVRGMTLTWTSNLSWAGSSTDREDPNMGLTEFGREVVREMNRLGMIVDISHVSEQTFWETLEVTRAPVVASHSCAHALCGHPRNLTDDQLAALAKNGGVVGIAVYPLYLSNDWGPVWEEAEQRLNDRIETLLQEHDGESRDPAYRDARRRLIMENIPEDALVTVDTFIDHIEHVIKVAGAGTVAMGSDYDGVWSFPVGLEKPSEYQAVVEGLRARGHSEDVIRRVMGDNVRRVFRRVLDK